MILGITGKSGTGKHTAAKFLEQKGWKVLDVDKIAHKLYRPYQNHSESFYVMPWC